LPPFYLWAVNIEGDITLGGGDGPLGEGGILGGKAGEVKVDIEGDFPRLTGSRDLTDPIIG
jgi:hypothetical protein